AESGSRACAVARCAHSETRGLTTAPAAVARRNVPRPASHAGSPASGPKTPQPHSPAFPHHEGTNVRPWSAKHRPTGNPPAPYGRRTARPTRHGRFPSSRRRQTNRGYKADRGTSIQTCWALWFGTDQACDRDADRSRHEIGERPAIAGGK